MKSKNFLVLTLSIGLIAGAAAFKVDVCHNVDNNPHVINIALPAAIAHMLQHPNDKLGGCSISDENPPTSSK